MEEDVRGQASEGVEASIAEIAVVPRRAAVAQRASSAGDETTLGVSKICKGDERRKDGFHGSGSRGVRGASCDQCLNTHSGLEVEQGEEHEELSLRKSFTYNLLLGLQEPWRTKTLHA